jgi:hypothetical protein
MRRKGLEWRSKKYAPVQNVSVVNGYTDAEDFRQKYKTGRVGVKKRADPRPRPLGAPPHPTRRFETHGRLFANVETR